MIRKTLVLTAVLFGLIVASAQAHGVFVTTACGSVTLQWYNFNDGAYGNRLNGGMNDPTWSVAFTPVGQTSATTQQGQVSFDNSNTQRNVAQYTLTVQIPPVNGTVVVRLGLDQPADERRQFGLDHAAADRHVLLLHAVDIDVRVADHRLRGGARTRRRDALRRLQPHRVDHLATVRAQRPDLLESERAVGDDHERQRRRPVHLPAAHARAGRYVPLGRQLRR